MMAILYDISTLCYKQQESMRFLEVNIDGCKDLQHEVEGNDDSMKT
jgi:hypothetical protein